MKSIERTNVLGIGISAINIPITLRVVEEWISDTASHYICITPVHSVMMCQDESELRQIFNASGLTTPDGMPLVWISRLKGHKHVSRVYGPDLMLALCEHSIDPGYRHYFYGGAEGVPEKLAVALQHRYPGLQVVGAYSPPFRALTSEEDAQIVEMLNQAEPDIVWVGLGAPKQERWMASHLDRLNASVLIGVGAAFDFHTGRKPQAPGWMQRNGLEWLFRLLTEPKRLWKRYLYNNPRFIALILMQSLGLRRYTLDVDQGS
jgi:N-acetylglucosaminyldiphosphoundecaprenol N-acetyl-beta-D-mannosaminyltransferase